MKKQLLIFVFFIISTIIFAQKKSYNIGILLDNRTEEIDPLLLQLQNQIKAVVGEDADVNFPEGAILVNNYNLEKAAQNYNQLLADETDIILAFGVVNNKIVSSQKEYAKPTILFGAVNRDFNSIDFSKKASGIKNLTYLVESESFLEDFKKFQEFTNFKTLGIVIERPFLDILPLKKNF